MRVATLAAHGVLGTVELDTCSECRLLWFDRTESIVLAPESVVAMFRLIGEVAAPSRRPLASTIACPRCTKPLALTHDLQRTTRFTYWRCAAGHGRLIGFSQFLREKNFVREPSRAELEKLRATVRQIACSQCGAPVNLVRDSACTHCGSPIALIDPDGVAKALEQLAKGKPPTPPTDAASLRRQLAEAQATAILEGMRTHAYDDDMKVDLLRAGAGALAAIAAAWLARR
jgi:hypothetical protein